MSQITPPTVTPLPPAPATSSPSTFSTLADAFIAALATFRTQLVALAANCYDNTVDAFNSATNAAASAVTATTQANAAAAGANAPVWVSGTAYTVGAVRYSPIDFRSYRRKTGGAGTTDPSADGTNWILVSIGPFQCIRVSDRKASGASSGTPVLGINVRTLNTTDLNTLLGASLASNTVTLTVAGTYDFEGRCPASSVTGHQAQLYDSTGGTVLAVGSSAKAAQGVDGTTDSIVRHRMTIAGTTTIQLRHYIQNTSSGTPDFGRSVTSGNSEVFAEMLITKVA